MSWMRDTPFPAEHRHALVVLPCAPEVLPDLKSQGLDVAPWVAPSPSPGFGETLVHGMMAALAQHRPPLLVLPDPEGADPGQRALALAGLEAARRSGGVACAWRHAAAGGQPQAPGPPWTLLGADALPDALPTRQRGIHADDARMPTCEDPPAGAAWVSVVVRSMDRPSLVAALDAIALQTYRAVEVVIVNARGPGHGPLPAHCGGLPVLRAAPTPGRPLRRAEAANLGVDTATGAMVLFLDDDDLLLPDHLSRLVDALNTHPAAPAAYTDVALGRLDGSSWQQTHCFSAGFDRTRLLFENYLPIHGVMFRRATFSAGVRFDESFDLFEDWDLWLQLAEQGDFVHVPGVSARYVVSDTEQSDVFSDSPAAQAARERLYEKWRHRSSPGQYAAVLRRLQSLYREAHQAQAQVTMLQASETRLQAVVAARETELADAAQMLRSWQEIAAARDREIADAASHAAGLQGIVAEREREIAAAAAQTDSLRGILTEREREIASALVHAAGLDHILAERQRELADALSEIGALRVILEARDREIADQARSLEDLDTRIAALLAEGPLQALKRTLSK